MKKTFSIIGALAAVVLLGAGCARPTTPAPASGSGAASPATGAAAEPKNAVAAPTSTTYRYPVWGFSVQIPNALVVQPLDVSKNATTPPEDVYTLNARTPSGDADYQKNKQDALRPALTVEVSTNPKNLSVLDWAKAHEADVPAKPTDVTVAGVPGIMYTDAAVGLTAYIFPAATGSSTGKMAAIMATKEVAADQLNAIVGSVKFDYSAPPDLNKPLK